MWFLLPRLTKVLCQEGKFQRGARGEISKRGSLREREHQQMQFVEHKLHFPIKTNDQAQESNYYIKCIKQQKFFCGCLICFAAFWGSAVAFAVRFWDKVGRAPHGTDIKRARPRLAYRRAPGQIPSGPARPLGPSSAFWHGSWDQILKKYRIELSYICWKTNELGGGLSVLI